MFWNIKILCEFSPFWKSFKSYLSKFLLIWKGLIWQGDQQNQSASSKVDTFLQILRKIFKRQSRITLFDVSWFFHEQNSFRMNAKYHDDSYSENYQIGARLNESFWRLWSSTTTLSSTIEFASELGFNLEIPTPY